MTTKHRNITTLETPKKTNEQHQHTPRAETRGHIREKPSGFYWVTPP